MSPKVGDKKPPKLNFAELGKGNPLEGVRLPELKKRAGPKEMAALVEITPRLNERQRKEANRLIQHKFGGKGKNFSPSGNLQGPGLDLATICRTNSLKDAMEMAYAIKGSYVRSSGHFYILDAVQTTTYEKAAAEHPDHEFPEVARGESE